MRCDERSVPSIGRTSRVIAQSARAAPPARGPVGLMWSRAPSTIPYGLRALTVPSRRLPRRYFPGPGQSAIGDHDLETGRKSLASQSSLTLPAVGSRLGLGLAVLAFGEAPRSSVAQPADRPRSLRVLAHLPYRGVTPGISFSASSSRISVRLAPVRLALSHIVARAVFSSFRRTSAASCRRFPSRRQRRAPRPN